VERGPHNYQRCAKSIKCVSVENNSPDISYIELFLIGDIAEAAKHFKQNTAISQSMQPDELDKKLTGKITRNRILNNYYIGIISI
jgi:hypothetical protein